MTKKIALFITCTVLLLSACSTPSELGRKERRALYSSSYNYEIQPAGVGSNGTKAVKVWGYGPSPTDAAQIAKRNAVAACIFRGIPAGQGVARTPAIVRDRDAHEKHSDFFDEFFEVGGRYLNFVAMSTDGPPSGEDRLRIERNYYKVGVYVQVMYDDLRRELEEEGIARRLDEGF